MEKLIPSEIKILEKKIKTGRQFQGILLGLAALAGVLFIVSYVLQWEFPASFFIGFFGSGFLLGFVLHIFIVQRKVVDDLKNGVKMSLEGTVTKKEMKSGYNSYYTDYSSDSLLELAEYIENKEKGIMVDHGVKDWNLNKAASSSFLIQLNSNQTYSIGIRKYIEVNINDKVRLTLAPKSGVVFSVDKI